MDDTMSIEATAPDIEPECYPCVIRQALRTAQAAGLDGAGQKDVLEVALKGLLRHKGQPRSTQDIGRGVTDRATRIAGKWIDHDIYRDAKRKADRIATSYVPKLRSSIRDASDPLAMAIRVATAGNIIDFGAKDHATLDLERECDAILTQPFGRFDIDTFRQLLEGARNLLYVCDNAGEIVFDLLLMEALASIHPEVRIHAALRERPILNDATVEDALAIGMDRHARVISSGSIFAGTDLERCNDEFRHLFESADIVLSKGQGNYSTLRHAANDRLFFSLRIKCATVARLSGLELDALQFIHATES